MTQNFRRFDYTDVGHNIARGILPTVDGVWDTPPSNLANVTDGNSTTGTGTGTTVIGSAASLGALTLDFGRLVNALILIRGTIWSLAGASYHYNITPLGVTGGLNNTKLYGRNETSEKFSGVIPAFQYGSGIHINVWGNAADTFYVKFYEIIALEVFP